MYLKHAGLLLAILLWFPAKAQDNSTNFDSSITAHQKDQPLKLKHAEPLFIDLIRDLGARKGEKEWNIGLGLIDGNHYEEYTALVEYEWAPIDRLGLEVELPFSFFSSNQSGYPMPENRLNSLKMAAQYTFLVHEKWQTSMAFGYIQEIELNSFNRYTSSHWITGALYNPFWVGAKRWGDWHSLIYAGPQFIQHFHDNHWKTQWQWNTNLHYMIPQSRNFVGIECNKTLNDGNLDVTFRPQMRVALNEQMILGIVTGIPIDRKEERFSTFLRLIYEPKH